MSLETHEPKSTSEARRAAARVNGAKSHGPVTPEGKAKSALNAITHGLTANAVVLTTESKDKYAELLAAYIEEYDPQSQSENTLVQRLAAADWHQRRAEALITALLDVTMDRMEKEISEEFEDIDNATRTALAFERQVGQSGTLALLNRYAARHARDYHRVLNDLRKIQADRRGKAALQPPTEEKVQNEPNDSPASSPQVTPIATRPSPLATETDHRPPATDDSRASKEEIDDRIAS